MKMIHFISLGCPKNLVDSEVMLGQLSGKGYSFTTDPQKAEIIIVNTCAFIEDAKKEAIDTILSMGQIKKKGKCKMLIVAGCLPQRYKDKIQNLLPEVDMFIGTGDFKELANLIENYETKKVCVGIPEYLYDHKTARIRITPKHIGYIKISEGCFHPCSFCVIPKIRGKYRSRKPASIIEEAKQMLSQGVKEINIIGQDTTAYGRDLETSVNLSQLLNGIAELEYDKWIRVFYAYPHDFPDELINVIKKYSDICSYIDIPIQHINNRILRSMSRKGGSKEIFTLVDKLKSLIPDLSIRTSLIVGYPGETDEEFDELLNFVSWAKFDHLGVFKYSDEEGTRASKLKKKVEKSVAEARYDEVMKLQQNISYDNNRKFLGTILQVLVDEKTEQGVALARHSGQGYEVDGNIRLVGDNIKEGTFNFVKITDFDTYDLEAETISTVNALRNIKT